ADGWLPIFFSPKSDGYYRAALAEGFGRPGARRAPEDFEVSCVVPSIVGDDVEACADLLRPMYALYIGGMGARDVNFHFDVFSRLGYEGACHDIQDLYLAGRKAEAIAKVPTALVQDVSLIGPVEKIAEELPTWRDTCLTTMLVSGPPFLLEQVADIVNT
ncbi:MAG TPA: LLM class flavin-dependent oxidoreductase, partial [Acidimicrobiales bacterium]|nr:LLM class flavin-dependent oxidoreductase [Acidimicrobiales bacterium]